MKKDTKYNFQYSKIHEQIWDNTYACWIKLYWIIVFALKIDVLYTRIFSNRIKIKSYCKNNILYGRFP